MGDFMSVEFEKGCMNFYLANAIAGNPSTALILWPERGTLVPCGRFSEVEGWWTLEEEDACKTKKEMLNQNHKNLSDVTNNNATLIG